jgi:hypothetical protein
MHTLQLLRLKGAPALCALESTDLLAVDMATLLMVLEAWSYQYSIKNQNKAINKTV